ncbi:MAG TPA: right-handed parallel beta-helix repeat-containing protein [Armatimonadaceae bacterium]|nr:right-handed parallel beta-helix repeat-containing protein [Armatimonadaceae bacterium]
MADTAPSAPPVPLRPGDLITTSRTLRRETVSAPDAHEDDSGGAAVVIAGDDLTVDFNGLTLLGTSVTAEPDVRQGIGVLVRGRNVTIRNARVRGYKVGLLARDAPGLQLLDCDFSHNWKQRLRSTPASEDLSDWMSFHHNENGEWLRYGAGIYLDGCDGFLVRGCRVTGGQCGLMVSRSERGLAYNNDFSFLSAVGIGLYRASGNRVLHNRIDWCVRGYSHGVYNRGQDSAGILVFEQCHRNTFAYNSVTHGGDGFFLWAGQTTMDTGQGGCNDNVLFGNDFSHAPTNGIEATFSRNTFANNLILDCWHGIWGGYSYETSIEGNVFGWNAEAIAIEHGQDNLIARNRFRGDRTAVRLWSNRRAADPDWGYARQRDTRSRDYDVRSNAFEAVGVALDVADTSGVRVAGDNAFRGESVRLKRSGDTPGLEMAAQDAPPDDAETLPGLSPSAGVLPDSLGPDEYRDALLRGSADWDPFGGGGESPVAPLPDGQDPFLAPGAARGRCCILVDEWGPYDFRRPLLWADQGTPDDPAISARRFRVLGPEGTWRVVILSPGATLSANSGSVPGEVTATFSPAAPGGAAVDVRIGLEYVGAETTDYRGVVTPAGEPVPFGWAEFRLPIDWSVRWYAWDDATDPRTRPESFAALIAGEPLAEESRSGDLAYAWGGAPADGVPADRFATVAEGTFTAPPGEYVLEVTTDDGCRVTLDGVPVLTDAWKYQAPTRYARDVTIVGPEGTPHALRVEHFEIDGYATLQVRLRPKR